MKNKGIIHSVTHRVSGALMALALLPIVSQAAVVTFDDSAEISSDFTLIGTAGTGGLVASTGNGLSSSNCVAAQNNASSGGLYYKVDSIPTRSSFDMGVYFYWTTPTESTAGQIVTGVAGASTLGSGEALNYTISRTNVTTGNQYGFRAHLEKQASTTNYRLRLANVVDATSGGTFSNGSYNITLTTGNWYFLQLAGVYDPADETYDLTARLYNSNSSGTLGSLVANGSRSVTNWLNNDVLTDPDSLLTPFFGGAGVQVRTGVRRYDNLTYNPGAATVHAPVSLGLGGLSYGGTPFYANAIMHEHRNWMDSVSKAMIYRQNSDGTPNPQISALGYPNYLNSGQVLELWPGQNAINQIKALYQGQLVLEWEGSADLRLLSGATFNAAKSNTAATGLATNGKRVYNISSSTPNGAQVRLYAIGSTPITSVKLWMPDPADKFNSSLEGVLFHPSRVSLCTDREWASLRFMDLGQTNGSPQRDWVDRRRPDDCFGVGIINRRSPAPTTTHPGNRDTGMAYEHMILLCNEINRNMWLCVPHMATDAYMDNLANLIAYGSDGDTPYTSPQSSPVYPPLNSSLKVFFEYSNEIWANGSTFAQGNWAENEAALLGISRAKFNARQNSKLWEKLEARIGANRVHRVAAVWTNSESYTNDFINEYYNNSLLLEPEIISPTTYFGHGIQWWVYDNFPNLPGLLSDPYWTSPQFEDDLASTFAQWELFALARLKYSESGSTGQDGTIGLPDYIRDIALARGLDIIAYEGGPGIYTDSLDHSGTADDGITNFILELNRRQSIGGIYDIVINQAFERGLRTHSMFIDVGTWGKFGQWGHLEYLTENRATSPKWSTMRLVYDEMGSFTNALDDPTGTRPVFTTPAALPRAEVGLSYSQTIQFSGGEGTRTVDVIGMRLVAGLSYNESALTITGTPTASGTNSLYLRVFDADGDVSWRTFSFKSVQRSTNPEVTINFEQFALQENVARPFLVGAYNFNTDHIDNKLNIHGITAPPHPGGWPSKVLKNVKTGSQIRVERNDGAAFDLAEFDIGGNQSGSARVTVLYPDNTQEVTICSFPNNQLNPMTRHALDIVGAKRVSFVFYYGTTGSGTVSTGGIDNLRIK